jgi:hypothetical protein
MAVFTTYWPGGFNISAPAQNKATQLDGGANTFTTWNQAGAQTLQRALTAAEQALSVAADAAATAQTNQTTLQSRAQDALTNNIAALALPDPTPANQSYLAIATPTQAQAVAQVTALTRQNDALVAQTTALTRQVNALIRLAMNLLDTTDGT